MTFEHSALDAKGFGAVELYLAAPRDAQLQLTLETAAGDHIVELVVDGGGGKREGRWSKIRVPLPGLAEANGGRVRLHIQDVSGTGVHLLLDDVRLVDWNADEEPSDLLAELLEALRNLFGLGEDSGNDVVASTAPEDRPEGQVEGFLGALGRQR